MTTEKPSSTSASRVRLVLILLAAGLVMVDVLGGWLLRSIHPHSTANPVAKVAMKGTRTLILGSSTAKYAFDPAVLWPDTYNASRNGLGLFSVAAFMRNLPAGTKVQRVIIGVDPADFVNGYQHKNIRQLKRLSDLAVHDRILREQLALTNPYTELKFYSGLYPFRKRSWSLLREWWKPDLSGNGYTALTGTLASVQRWQPAAAMPKVPKPEALAAFDQIVVAARRHNIQLVLVVTPIAGDQRRQIDPQYAKVMQAVRSKVAGGGICDLSVIEAPEIGRLAMDGTLFRDGSHFNGDGARRYSRIVKKLVDRHCRSVIEAEAKK